MSQAFSEKTFLLNLLDEIAKCKAVKTDNPILSKLAKSYRDFLVREDIESSLTEIRKKETQLKSNLLQAIKAERWEESSRITQQISAIANERATLSQQIHQLAETTTPATQPGATTTDTTTTTTHTTTTTETAAATIATAETTAATTTEGI